MLRSILISVYRDIFGRERRKLDATYPGQPGPYRHTHTHTSWPLDPVSCHTRWYLGQGLVGRWQPIISLRSTEHAQGTFSASASRLGLTYILHTVLLHASERPKQTGCWPWCPAWMGVRSCVSHFCTTFKITFSQPLVFWATCVEEVVLSPQRSNVRSPGCSWFCGTQCCPGAGVILHRFYRCLGGSTREKWRDFLSNHWFIWVQCYFLSFSCLSMLYWVSLTKAAGVQVKCLDSLLTYL